LPNAKITALGLLHATRVLTNSDLEQMVQNHQSMDNWSAPGYRSGISPNPMSPPRIMAACAARIALDQRRHRRAGAGLYPGVHGHAGYGCSRPPPAWFSTSSLKGAWGFDLIAACSGFLYGLPRERTW